MLLVRAALLQVPALYNCQKTDCFNVREITKACGLFRIAEIRAVERTLKNLRRPLSAPLHDVTVRLAVTVLVSEQDFATK
jgi:hypothetical protein